MNVLVACEYSGVVRDSFEDAGWNAWSCDILPTESEQTKAAGKHIQGDVMQVLYPLPESKIVDERTGRFEFFEKEARKWDLLIGHPPCTYLSFAYTGAKRYDNERLQKKIDAYQFFLDLWNAPIEHICLENPMGYAHTGLLPYTQIVEPYYFGHDYKKKTCLWLKNLPKLQYSLTDNLFDEKTAVPKPEPVYIDKSGKRRHITDALSGSRNGGHKRSITSHGIARAMAGQWTEYIKQLKIKRYENIQRKSNL